MRALVMAVTIVQAGKCVATFIALETRGCGGRGLDVLAWGGSERRWVRVAENPRGDKRGRGDVLDLIGLTVGIRQALLLLVLLVRCV